MFTWLTPFLPESSGLSLSQRLVIVAGACLGIGLTALLCGWLKLQVASSLWIMAPLGATAAQIFAVPSSPMSQPWPVVAGHAVSALAGLIVYHLFGHTSLAAALAVGLAVLLMIQARALHPSGGGTALLIVLSRTSDWTFILFPAVTNAFLLVAAAMAWHRVTGQAYPRAQRLVRTPHNMALHRFVPDDLEAALKTAGMLEISPGDAERLIAVTELQAFRRMAAGLTCGDVMTRNVHTIAAATRVQAAQKIMRQRDVNALPVTDDDNRVLGLLRMEETLARPDARAYEVMMLDYFRRDPKAPAAELIDLFEQSDRRYVVVLDEGRLAGIIAKSDLMASLFHAAA